MPTAETDINAAYEDAIHVLSTKLPKEEKNVDQQPHRKTFTATSGQSARFSLFRAVTDIFFTFFAQRVDVMGTFECG